MKRKTTPSDMEFSGLYNAGLQSRIHHRRIDRLNTSPNLPSLTLEEVKQVSKAAYEIIFQHANRRSYSSEEVKEYYSLCISEQLEDRTLNISFIGIDDCTFDLINQLQHLLIKEHNLWRIRIAGASPESTMIIYPSVIRFGMLPIGVVPKTGWLACLKREREISGKLRDTVEKKHHIIRRAIRSIIADNLEKRVTIVTGFDNYNGDSSKVTLWTICKTDDPDLNLIKPIESMAGDEFYVKADGDFGYHVKDDAPYWIKEWIFPSDNSPSSLVFQIYDRNYNTSRIKIIVKPTFFD
jgi:hypothetical protein